MDSSRAAELLGRLHAAQTSFYAGGSAKPVRAVLTDDVEWHVPGKNAIAGEYHGIAEVMSYFARRRDLAQRSLRLHPGELLVGTGQHVASLTDGSAVVGGERVSWSTVGLYRVRDERVAACWLLPLDPLVFDRIWAA